MWLLSLLTLSVVCLTACGYCPERCECNDDVLVVECSRGGLDVLPITLNPGIQRLQLRHNSIRAVDAALGFYGQLQFLDLSHNELVAVPDRGFRVQARLVELRLADNKLSQVTITMMLMVMMIMILMMMI